MNKSKTIKSTLLAALSVLLLGSCMKNQEPEPPQPVSFVSIFNGYKGASGLMPQINGQNLYNAPLSFGEISLNPFFCNNEYCEMPYLELGIGTQELGFIIPPNNSLGSEISQSLEENKFYSWFVYGTDNDNARHVAIEDPITRTSNDNAPKIRFFNLANGIEEVDLYFEFADPESDSGERREISVVEGRAQEDEASMEEHKQFIPNNQVTRSTNIRVKDATEEDLTIVEEKNYNFQPDRHYTILLVNNDNSEATEDDEPSLYKIVVSVFRY